MARPGAQPGGRFFNTSVLPMAQHRTTQWEKVLVAAIVFYDMVQGLKTELQHGL